jgi:hypothetical protein
MCFFRNVAPDLQSSPEKIEPAACPNERQHVRRSHDEKIVFFFLPRKSAPISVSWSKSYDRE